MTSHSDTLIAPRQKGERFLRKKTSMVTTQSFVLCEKTTHCDRPTTWYIIYCKQKTALHGGCSLSCDRGKHDHMIKANPSLTNAVNRMCATLRLHDIS